MARSTRKILDEMRAKAERDNAEPPLALPVRFEVQSWNEAGFSQVSTFTMLPPNRTPGRR